MDLGKELRELTVMPLEWPKSEPVVMPEPMEQPQEVEIE